MGSASTPTPDVARTYTWLVWQVKRRDLDELVEFRQWAVSLPDQSGVHDAMVTPIRSVPAPIEVAEIAAFEEFFDVERTRLFGALAAMSGNRAEAEEVMQDAFLKVGSDRHRTAFSRGWPRR